MLARVESTMDMTALTIPKDDKIVHVRIKFALESSPKRIRFASSKI